jgi:hypothetical protein
VTFFNHGTGEITLKLAWMCAAAMLRGEDASFEDL